jgi:hypothetical protein
MALSTYDKSTGLAGPVIPAKSIGSVQVVKLIVDLDKAKDGIGTAKPGTSETVGVLNIVPGSVIMAYGARQIRTGAGTAVTLTFGSVVGTGSGAGVVPTIAGTASGINAAGTILPATVTSGLVGNAATGVQLTISATTQTAATDLGSYEFYAVVADLNAV